MLDHRTRSNTGSAIATFVLLLISLPAQQRLATAGRALDAASQPLPGATVAFVGAKAACRQSRAL